MDQVNFRHLFIFCGVYLKFDLIFWEHSWPATIWYIVCKDILSTKNMIYSFISHLNNMANEVQGEVLYWKSAPVWPNYRLEWAHIIGWMSMFCPEIWYEACEKGRDEAENVGNAYEAAYVGHACAYRTKFYLRAKLPPFLLGNPRELLRLWEMDGRCPRTQANLEEKGGEPAIFSFSAHHRITFHICGTMVLNV